MTTYRVIIDDREYREKTQEELEAEFDEKFPDEDVTVIENHPDQWY
jgi:hypothetical protein